MKLLHVGAFPFPGPQDAPVYLAGLTRALAQAGHHVVLVCDHAGGGKVATEVDVARAQRLPTHWGRAAADVALARSVHRQLGRRRFDMLHVHGARAPLLAWLSRLARRHGVPVVVNQSLTPGSVTPAGMAARLGGGAVAVCARGRDALAHRGIRQIALIRPGLDPVDLVDVDDKRARQRWDLGTRAWIAATDGPGLSGLASAVARLGETGLLVVSDRASEHDERTWDRGGLPAERRRFVAVSDVVEWAEALAVGQVFVGTAGSAEGFPMALLHALGLGRPAVLTKDAMQPVAGVVGCDEADVVQMSAVLGRLLGDRAEREALGQAGWQDVRGRWSWTGRAAELTEFYEHILA